LSDLFELLALLQLEAIKNKTGARKNRTYSGIIIFFQFISLIVPESTAPDFSWTTMTNKKNIR
jgi:hypothetical protein